jgi:hypothetical protein
MNENSKKSKTSYWKYIIGVPIFWGVLGLIQGKGFFPYILESIWALIILGLIFGALIFILLFSTNK